MVDYPDGTLPIVHVGTITVEGTVSISGTVAVSGTVSISGTVTVTGSVTVSGAVTIGTIAADNIIIDKLTVGAYTERRSTLSNDGTITGGLSVTGNVRDGKFYPRGARGWIETINVYCMDLGAAGGTITVYISPHPSMGYVASATVTIPAGGGWAWRNATFNRMWNYDSLFIFVVCSESNIVYGYDETAPYDRFYSTDAGVSWTAYNNRNYFRVTMKGETCGDVPVSGTLNTIEIPASSGLADSGLLAISEGAEVTLITVAGAGRLNYASFRSEPATNSHMDVFRIYCDNVKAYEEQHSRLTTEGVGASSPGVALTTYTLDGRCVQKTTILFPFKRELKIIEYSASGTGAHNVQARINYQLIS